jgi:ADP-heptose:LPS heptosyltransferase
MNIGIFEVNQLGDNVVFLPVVQALRKKFPDWRLFLATTPTAAALYDADVPPDRRLVILRADFNGAWRNPFRLVRLAVRVFSERLDGSVLADDQGNVAHLLALLAGGRIRIGMRREYVRVRGGLTHAVAPLAGVSPALQNWEIARAAVRAFGGGDIAPRPPAPDLGHLVRGAIRRPKRIIIHPGASMAFKRWHPDRFRELAVRLATDHEVIWIEQPELGEVQLPGTITRVASGSLQEFVHLLGTASLLVANNSGPMNLAAAIGTPAVIISGPAHPAWDPVWHSEKFLILRETSLPCLPCETERRAVTKCSNVANPMACMKAWSVQTVYERTVEWAARWAGDAANPKPCADS